MISYKLNGEVDINRLIELFIQAGWTEKAQDKARVIKMIKNSQVVVTAWDYDRLVGFAKCTTDFAFSGLINNVIVDLAYRRQGIGRKLIEQILQSNEEVYFLLRTEEHNVDFYQKLGFKQLEYSFIYQHKS